MPSIVNPKTTAWDEIPGKPATFPPSSHTHEISEISGLQAALDGKMAAIRILRLALTSDAAGLVTVTYSPAFSATPQVILELSPAADNLTTARLTETSASGFKAIVEKRNSAFLSLLGINILSAGVTVVSGAPVRATVIEA